VASNWTIPLDGTARDRTFFSIGPGTRFHLGNDYYLLHFWEFPIVGPPSYTYSMQLGLVRLF